MIVKIARFTKDVIRNISGVVMIAITLFLCMAIIFCAISSVTYMFEKEWLKAFCCLIGIGVSMTLFEWWIN